MFSRNKTRRMRFLITGWFIAGFLIASLLIALLFVAYTVYMIVASEKYHLKNIARSIEREINQDDPARYGIPDATVQSINTKFSFIDLSGQLGYAIVSTNGTVVYKTPDFKLPVSSYIGNDSHRLYLVSVARGKDVDDILEKWRFLYSYNRPNYYILVYDYYRSNAFENFYWGLLILLPFLIAIPVIIGFIYSNRIILPLNAIHSTLLRIRNGELHARIPGGASLGIIIDLVDRLNRTFAELEQSFYALTRFSADAAHEIKSPITAIRGTLEVTLAHDRTSEEYQNALSECLDELAGLSHIVDNLLLLATPESKASGFNFFLLDYTDCIATVVDTLTPLAEKSGVSLSLQAPQELMVFGDEMLLSRMAYNLIHNAIKFSPAGSSITAKLYSSEDGSILEVRDEGIGIEPAHLNHIFDRFYQVGTSRQHGSGLGLSIVKWIVNVHEGTIAVTSKPGKGTAFTVTLSRMPSS